MKRNLFLACLIFCCAQIFWGGKVWGQTYTTTGNSTNWNSSAAWVKTNPDGCPTFASTSNTPPLGGAPYNPFCFPVKIVINHPIIYSGGNTSIGGGNYHSITINSGGNVSFNGNLSVNNSGNNPFTFQLNGTGKMKVGGTLVIQAGAKLNTSNVSNQSPNATVEVGNLTLQNSGSGHQVSIGVNTTLTVSGVTNLQGGGGINLAGKMSTNSFTSTNFGGLFFKMTGDAKLDVSTSFYQGGFPFNIENNSQVKIGGNYTLVNSGANDLQIKNNSSFTVAGNTDISETFQVYDQASVIFEKNVAVAAADAAILRTFNSASILIQGNLSTVSITAGTVSSNNQSSIVICGSLAPQTAGATGGVYPPESNQNISRNDTSYYGGCRILPIEILSFTATYQKKLQSGLINWTTAKEWENSHFEIERAVNSVNTWETIGRAEGSGYSDQPLDYAYEDTNLPPAGGNIFYRLKQHDLDGDVSFSDIKSIRVGAMSGTSLWRVFPNPTTGNRINLEILDCGLYHDEPITVRIISASGQFDIIESKAGSPLNELLSERLTNKSAGVYTLEISWGIQREYHKILLTR